MSHLLHNQQFQVKLHRSEHGYRDYDVIGHPTLRRACVPLNIRRGWRELQVFTTAEAASRAQMTS